MIWSLAVGLLFFAILAAIDLYHNGVKGFMKESIAKHGKDAAFWGFIAALFLIIVFWPIALAWVLWEEYVGVDDNK